MRSKKNVETTKLKEGETLNKEFNNYVEMAENAVDWTLFCSYQLKPSHSEGYYKILQLPSMQIASTCIDGGIMFNFVVPEECITFSVLKHVKKKACIEQMKLETGMIAVIDDKKKYNILYSDTVEVFDISLNKKAHPELLKKLENAVDNYYIDTNQTVAKQLDNIVNRYAHTTTINSEAGEDIEAEVTQSILNILNTQEAQTPHFTKSEKIAIEIKQKLFKHMDHTMSVETLAKNHNISVKSLQNAFKSLFGLRPNEYMRLLKLNLVHHELTQSNASHTSVQKVARKWGFRHMGRFSKYYTELFGENPSITLKNKNPLIHGINTHCVERQEEML